MAQIRTILIGLGALIVVAPAAAVVFAWSGLYNVAASSGHLPPVRWFLHFGMENSVETYALGVAAPPLDDPALSERGMLYFPSGCAPCHGAPGTTRSPITKQMLPPPPELDDTSMHWEPEQLFRIVKHGIKYTGMPAWPSPTRDDEVWAIVAFLQSMKTITPEAYRAATSLDVQQPEAARAIAREGLVVGPFACASCHGLRGQGSPLGSVPRLAGQKAAYLEAAMIDFALGARPSGMMQTPAVHLDERQRRDLAQYYASISPEPADGRESVDADVKVLQHGGAIASVGDASRGIPACSACHGQDGHARNTNPEYPVLAGQHASYLANQLQLFRAGDRGGRHAQIMSMAVRNLTDDDISATALYYSRLK